MVGEGFSILIADDLRSVKFASGIAERPEVQDAVFSHATMVDVPLTTINVGDETMFVISRKTEGAVAYFIHRGKPDDSLIDFVVNVPFAAAILRHFINSPFEAMTVIDAEGHLKFMSPVHESFFGLKRGESIGKKVTEVIENTRLHEVISTGRAEIAQVQEMKGVRRVVTRVPIVENNKVIGAIGQVMFKEPQQIVELGRELERLRSEVGRYRREISELQERSHGLEQIVGRSEVIRQLKADIIRIAPLDVPVLLLGESGTGKELAAQAIHMLSQRREKNMVLVNAAALPATLVESELFGYEPGSFTGAERRGRVGKFEQAHNSSLFLDEIGDMPIEIQAKLLRVLEDGRFERIGGEKTRQSSFRLVSATNRNVEGMIEENKFRLDLYYRISSVVLRLPPLRDRREDIPLLAQHFIESFNRRHQKHVRYVDPRAMDFLMEQSWHGNVRQLQHAVERAIIFSGGHELTVENFQTDPAEARRHPVRRAAITAGRIDDAIGSVERTLIFEAMARLNGNKKRVAAELGISRSYLYKKLEQLSFENLGGDNPPNRSL